jgi:hypothetical protein
MTHKNSRRGLQSWWYRARLSHPLLLLIVLGLVGQITALNSVFGQEAAFTIQANDEGKLSKIAFIERDEPKSTSNTSPAGFSPSPPSLDVLRSKLIFNATWSDGEQSFEVNISQFNKGQHHTVYLIRTDIPGDRLQLAKLHCKNTPADTPQEKFKRYFVCKRLVDILEQEGTTTTQAYYTAFKGWFYAAYHLAYIGDGPISVFPFGDDIKEKVREFIRKYDERKLSRSDVDNSIDVSDVKNQWRRVATKDIFLSKLTNQLINSCQLKKASIITEHLISLMSDSDLARESSIEKVTMKDLMLHQKWIQDAEKKCTKDPAS